MSDFCVKLVTPPTPVVVGSSTITATEPFLALEPVVPIAWASSDLDLFTPASAPLLQAEDRAISSANTTTPSPGSERKSHATTSSSGLSTGVKVGIATGSICGLLVIVLLVLLLSRMRNHHLQKKERATKNGALEGNLNHIESDTLAIFEASSESKPAEADSSNARVELDGYWHGYEVEARTMLPSRRAEF